MNLDFGLVPYGRITEMLPSLMEYLKKSEIWTHERACIDDIVAFLYSGRMNLWVAYNEAGEVYGHIITEIKEYPRQKMLVLQYCAAEDNHMQYMQEKVFNILESFAKDSGCVGIEIFGRTGWKSHVAKFGYELNACIFEKYFKE